MFCNFLPALPMSLISLRVCQIMPCKRLDLRRDGDPGAMDVKMKLCPAPGPNSSRMIVVYMSSLYFWH